MVETAVPKREKSDKQRETRRKNRREGGRQGKEMRTSLSDKHQQDLDLRKFDGK